MSGGGGAANREAQLAREAEQKRQAEIRLGTRQIDRRFEQFDEDFFKGRETAFTDFAMPQLDDQREDAGDDLSFFLARSGLADSNVRADKGSELEKLFELERQGIVDQGRQAGTEARDAVEGARTDLVSLLQTTGDARGAAEAAQARAASLSRTPAYSPVGQLFTDFTAGLGTQAQFERAAAYGGPKPRYDTGLFSNPGAVRTY
jgi:hypothetical protein